LSSGDLRRRTAAAFEMLAFKAGVERYELCLSHDTGGRGDVRDLRATAALASAWLIGLEVTLIGLLTVFAALDRNLGSA
jgi:hypothetical protein